MQPKSSATSTHAIATRLDLLSVAPTVQQSAPAVVGMNFTTNIEIEYDTVGQCAIFDLKAMKPF